MDDNYGLDQFIRVQMKKVFPELSFVLLPPGHPVYHQKYNFPGGLPKIHEHNGKPARLHLGMPRSVDLCAATYTIASTDEFQKSINHKT